MYFKSKYIVTEDDIPVVFSELAPSHAEVALALFPNRKIAGAGFCYIETRGPESGRYVCYGESISLRVKSRSEVDSKILNRYMGVDDI